MVVIAVSGQAGCGSSTVAKLLAEKLRLKFFSVGDYYKKAAARHCSGTAVEKSLKFLSTKKGSGRSFNAYIERMQKSAAKRGDVVIDSKIGVQYLRGIYDLGVWLKAPLKVRASRYVKREHFTFREALHHVKEKDAAERRNFRKLYGFDSFSQEKMADIVINTAKKTPEQIANLIISSMKRVFIVHGWEGSPRADWYPYAKKELRKKGYTVDVLKMPDPDSPTEKKWVQYLSRKIGAPTTGTYLIGHSAGCITILRYLEQLKKGEKIGGCVLVAGWIDDLGYKELKNFFKKPVKWAKIRGRCRKFVAIHSDNDPFVKLYHGAVFRKKLRAKLVVERKKGHMTGEEGIRKLPSAVRALEEISRK